MMVPAGAPVDGVIRDLKPHLSAGDILMDGGNTHFQDTTRRMEELEGRGILHIGTGVSGGEEGALLGPSIMPGGNPEAWPFVKLVLQSIAAKVDDGIPCCDWIGKGGAGHFVKMIHNGIEYGDMQMICEAYYLMERLLGLTPDVMSDIFAEWNKGELNSYLKDRRFGSMVKRPISSRWYAEHCMPRRYVRMHKDFKSCGRQMRNTDGTSSLAALHSCGVGDASSGLSF